MQIATNVLRLKRAEETHQPLFPSIPVFIKKSVSMALRTPARTSIVHAHQSIPYPLNILKHTDLINSMNLHTFTR